MAKIKIGLAELRRKIKEAKSFKKPNTKQEKKKEDDDDGGGHLIDLDAGGGNLSRDGSHPYWGYRYMINKCDNESAGITDANRYKERREIYSDFIFKTDTYTPTVAAEFRANFKFPTEGSPDANFCTQAKKGSACANQKFPYRWQSHHIIPDEIYNTGKKPIFNDDEKKLLIAAGYNINHGHNIIFLPGSGGIPYVPVHGLAQHYGSHPKYSDDVHKKVKKQSKAIKKELKKAKEDLDKDPHAKIKVGVVKDLRIIEQDQWKSLVKACRSAVKSKLGEDGDVEAFLNDKQGWYKLG